MTTFGSAIVNGAILSALLSLAVWIALRLTSRRALNAATRYAIWWIVLAATLALPLAYVELRAGRHAPAPASFPFGMNPAPELQWEELAAPAQASVAHGISLPVEIHANQWLRRILVIWILGSLLLLARVFVSYAALYRRSARATDAPPELHACVDRWLDDSTARPRRARLAISSEIAIPVATGPLRPTVLIPAKLFATMNAEDLEQIGRHEAAHLARRDDCSLFVQRVIEALFALHPVVRWLTRQIDLEREIACDDIAVGSTERAWSYADCLTRTVALCGGVRTSLAAANVADGRSHLSRRVELLVDRSRSGRTEILRGRCAVIAVALVCLAGLLAKAPLLLAFAVPPTGNPTPAPAQIDVPLQPPPARPLLAQASGANGAGVANEAGAKSFAGQLVRGNEQMKARQFDDAIATYQGIMSDAPDDRTKSDLWSRIGEAYRYKGDFAHGIQAMERADTLLPDNTAIATNLGLLYESQQDFAHARQYYEHALAINPNNPLVLNNLAYLLTQTGGDLDQALTYARTAQAKLPSFLEVDDTIGWIYLKKDMSSIAASEFWKATQAVPQNPEFHYHYALALYAEGNLFDALNECQTALANKPDKEMEGNIRSLIDKIAPESDVPFKRPQALRKPDQDQTK